MTILFKGFKIDWNNCDDCPASCDCPVCQHIDGYSMYGGRPNECPAFELPPHGRLIDADELVQYCERQIVEGKLVPPAIKLFCDKKYIDDAPTIIEAENGRKRL